MIKTDCRFFPLDRPCRFHKESGVHCNVCGQYTKVFAPSTKLKKILIIKIGAMGDVLRSTFLLPGIKQKYPNSEITWIVAPHSAPVLETNPYLNRIWPQDNSVFAKLAAEKFDVTINLDLSPDSLSLMSLSYTQKKIGFYLDEHRKIVCSNSYAEQWLLMSSFDDVKKKNKKTYQYWMSKIIGLERPDYEIYTPLLFESVQTAKKFAKMHKLEKKKIIGINPGAGKRWKLKKWTDEGFLEIIKRLNAEKCKVLLLGGTEEKELLSLLEKKSKGMAINAGAENSIPDFFALINLCDVVLTGDTMAMHAALGLKKKVAAVFGPTSEPEIEIYGRGVKIVSPAPCICCYNTKCDIKPDCMQLLKVDTVWNEIKKLI